MSTAIPSSINPAEFFTQTVANSIILPIIIDLSQVSNVPFLFSSISSSINQLKGVFPVYAFVYVLLKIETSDTYNLGGFCEDAFAEYHISPAIQSDEVDLGQKEVAIETILVKYRSKCSL